MRTILYIDKLCYVILEFREKAARVSNRCSLKIPLALWACFWQPYTKTNFPLKYQDAYDFMFLMYVFSYVSWVHNWGQDTLSPPLRLCVSFPLCLLLLSLCVFTVCTLCTDITLCCRRCDTAVHNFSFLSSKGVCDFVLSWLSLELKLWAEPQRSSGLWRWSLCVFLAVEVRGLSPCLSFCCCSREVYIYFLLFPCFLNKF